MKKELLLILIILVILASVWFTRQNSDVYKLNDILSTHTELKNYPYPFRVLRLENDIAIMTTPRSPEVSVLQLFKVTRPDLALRDPDSKEVIAAQKKLAQLQEEAKKIVLNQNNVKSVRWEIDKDWYHSYGINILQ